jgi:hypothetical protein
MDKRIILFILSVAFAAVLLFGLFQFEIKSNWVYLFSAVVFFGILVSNQQYEEDVFSKIERSSSAFFFSYILFFQFSYFPLNRFFFGQLVTQENFFSGILALVLFAIFFVLFGVISLVLNASSRAGLFNGWKLLNNNAMFFVFRELFLSASVMTILLTLKKYF